MGAPLKSWKLRALTAVLAGALGLSACGSSKTVATSTTTTQPISAAADRSAAQAISLTAADMPGWQESPNPPDSSDQSLGSQLSSCAGGPNEASIDVVDVSSSNFDQGSVEVSSDVQTVRSHADGLADLRSIESPKLVSCVDRIAKPQIQKSLPAGTTITAFDVSTFKPIENIPDAFGLTLHVVIQANSNGVTVSVPLYIREIGFLVGRAELTLNETEKGQPSSISVESHLVQILDSRAQAQPTLN